MMLPSRMNFGFCCLAATILSSVACPAAAAPSAMLDGFGEKGAVVFSARTSDPLLISPFGDSYIGATPFLGLQSTQYSEPENAGVKRSTSTTAFYVVPTLDYFVIDNLSIGGTLMFASLGRSQKTTTGSIVQENELPTVSGFGLMPRIGYDIPISSKFSFWPKIGVGFQRFSTTPSNGDIDRSSWWFADLDLALVFHPTKHLFVGISPGIAFTLSQSLSTQRGNRETTLSGYSTFQIRWLSATFGAWL